ncbi:hypothetical protein NIES2135_61430 (plasmid) [Leptolyngbya boryana NIES-2135]|uniref:Uncharacterized protein n=1 Tax=Leptolyngbya boryana NIES-2135 TaxID=1973484 RepID=A0A1Z4JRB7_LEPBY|nr:hypothetical protein NIES2135_61430 [Leptolyngbya boryana NIES-2135]
MNEPHEFSRLEPHRDHAQHFEIALGDIVIQIAVTLYDDHYARIEFNGLPLYEDGFRVDLVPDSHLEQGLAGIDQEYLAWAVEQILVERCLELDRWIKRVQPAIVQALATLPPDAQRQAILVLGNAPANRSHSKVKAILNAAALVEPEYLVYCAIADAVKQLPQPKTRLTASSLPPAAHAAEQLSLFD